MMDGSNPVVPKGHDVSKGESAPSSVTNPKKGQVLYLTANSASGSKYYSLNGSITQNGMPNYVAVQDQSKRTSLTNVTVTKNTFTVDTYYTDGTTPEKMDSFTIRRTEKPTLTVDAAGTTADNNQNNKSTSQNGKAGTSAKASVKGSKGARTGDNTLPVTLFACIMCAAGASLMFLAMFVLFMVLVGGRKGIRSLVGLMVAVFLILAFLIPAIYRGVSPVGMGILTALLITVFSMVLLNGISLKTSVAVVATLVGILAAAVVYYIFAAIFHISGYNLEGAEERILIRKIKQKNKHSL